MMHSSRCRRQPLPSPRNPRRKLPVHRDGYAWVKYGEKRLSPSGMLREYYKCRNWRPVSEGGLGCQARKVVDRHCSPGGSPIEGLLPPTSTGAPVATRWLPRVQSLESVRDCAWGNHSPRGSPSPAWPHEHPLSAHATPQHSLLASPAVTSAMLEQQTHQPRQRQICEAMGSLALDPWRLLSALATGKDCDLGIKREGFARCSETPGPTPSSTPALTPRPGPSDWSPWDVSTEAAGLPRASSAPSLECGMQAEQEPEPSPALPMAPLSAYMAQNAGLHHWPRLAPLEIPETISEESQEPEKVTICARLGRSPDKRQDSILRQQLLPLLAPPEATNTATSQPGSAQARTSSALPSSRPSDGPMQLGQANGSTQHCFESYDFLFEVASFPQVEGVASRGAKDVEGARREVKAEVEESEGNAQHKGHTLGGVGGSDSPLISTPITAVKPDVAGKRKRWSQDSSTASSVTSSSPALPPMGTISTPGSTSTKLRRLDTAPPSSSTSSATHQGPPASPLCLLRSMTSPALGPFPALDPDAISCCDGGLLSGLVQGSNDLPVGALSALAMVGMGHNELKKGEDNRRACSPSMMELVRALRLLVEIKRAAQASNRQQEEQRRQQQQSEELLAGILAALCIILGRTNSDVRPKCMPVQEDPVWPAALSSLLATLGLSMERHNSSSSWSGELGDTMPTPSPRSCSLTDPVQSNSGMGNAEVESALHEALLALGTSSQQRMEHGGSRSLQQLLDVGQPTENTQSLPPGLSGLLQSLLSNQAA